MKSQKGGSLLSVLLGLVVFVTSAQAMPIRHLPGLTTIILWERTGGNTPTPFVFEVGSAALTTQQRDPLSFTNSDFSTTAAEFYEIFYSDAQGIFDRDGAFLSIDVAFQAGLPAGGGLNIAEVSLHFADGRTEAGSIVESSTVLGDNAIPQSAEYAVDGDLFTHTVLGHIGRQGERLHLTIGFASTADERIIPNPEPATLGLFGIGTLGLLGVGWQRKRNRKGAHRSPLP